MTYTTTHEKISKKPKEILVFNYDYSTYINVDMHYVSFIEKNKRPFMLGKWKIKMKNK